MCPVSQVGCSAEELLNTACDPGIIQSVQARVGDIRTSQDLTWVGGTGHVTFFIWSHSPLGRLEF